MKTIAIRPAYTPLTQQKLCCVPCAVQWILLRNKLPIFTQEEIGIALELTVPKKYLQFFGPGVKTAKKKPLRGWGTKGSNNADTYNNFFKKHKVPLKATYIPLSKLERPAETIAANLKKGNDVMIITYMSLINPKQKWGHALIAAEIELGRNPKVTVGDPNYISRKFYKVPLSKIIKGMAKEVGRLERGIYIFKKK
jgi:hypothetical protein